TDDAKQEKDNQDDTESKEEITESKISPMEITTDQQVQNDGKHGVLLKPGAEPELSVNTRGDLNDFSTDETLIPVEKPKVSEITRSNSACSESSNGDGTTPTDYLLPKSPTNETTKETAVAVPGCVSSVTGSIMDERIVQVSRYLLLLEVTSSSLLTLTLEPQETGHFKFVELQDAEIVFCRGWMPLRKPQVLAPGSHLE
ncbi:hypothetical protein Tco_1414601, partial [Tanacetum coccineum]